MSETADADGRLLALYRRYVGEPASETDVYLGFALFFGGIALGLLGFLIFLGSLGAEPGTPTFWSFREVAISLAAVGMPGILAGIVVLLPVGRRARVAAAVGGAVCLVAVAVFVAVYPENWNVRGAADYSAAGIAVYASGLAVLVAATGAALVEHHLERARPAPDAAVGSGADGGDAAGSDATRGGDAESYSTERIQSDIDDAMADVELSWGGVEKRETKRLTLSNAASSSDIEASGFDHDKANTARSSGENVDDAVAGLQQLKGGQTDQATGGGVDEQTEALRELREQQQQQAEAQSEGLSGTISGLRDRFGL